MRCLFALLISLSAFTINANIKVTVVDDEDSSVLPYATVFGKSGIIVGLTNDNGEIVIASEKDFPIIIKCLGYEPLTLSQSEDTVRMQHSTVNLQEVVVTPVDRPVMRLVCYVREFASGATGADTIMNYNEHMADFFLPVREKVKGFKPHKSMRILRSRCYSRKTNSNGLDSIFVPDFRDDTFSWEEMVELSTEPVYESDRIRNGQRNDSVPGKYGVKHIMRKTNGNYIVKTDHLADMKSHSISPFIFKLLGLTIDFTEFQGSRIYKANDEGVYRPNDIVSGTCSFSVIGKGKWIKKAFKTDAPVQMYAFYEIYPIDIQYLTVDEARDLWRNQPAPRIEVSPNASQLDPAIQHIVDVCRQR